MSWLAFAFVSAGAAALTAILAKIGVEGVPSTLATAIRTVVVSAFAWAMVVGLDQHRAVWSLSRRSLIFLALSGLATGVSWLAYFRALQMAPASMVAPIDKLSLPLTVLLAGLWLRESVSWQAVVGVALMTVGALLTQR
jgi:bacterial/archaeal transporter family protein